MLRWVRHFKVGGDLVSSARKYWTENKTNVHQKSSIKAGEASLCWNIIFQPGLSSSCLRSAAGLDKCLGSPGTHLGPVLIPLGRKLHGWDVAEGLVTQRVPASIRDVGIAPGGV